MSDKTKLPCITLLYRLTRKPYNPILSSLDSIPYIDKNLSYPIINSMPMICFLQLNLDQIFSYLAKKE